LRTPGRHPHPRLEARGQARRRGEGARLEEPAAIGVGRLVVCHRSSSPLRSKWVENSYPTFLATEPEAARWADRDGSPQGHREHTAAEPQPRRRTEKTDQSRGRRDRRDGDEPRSTGPQAGERAKKSCTASRILRVSRTETKTVGTRPSRRLTERA